MTIACAAIVMAIADAATFTDAWSDYLGTLSSSASTFRRYRMRSKFLESCFPGLALSPETYNIFYRTLDNMDNRDIIHNCNIQDVYKMEPGT